MCRCEPVVVVGVDGSSASIGALLHACGEARARGGSVELVTAWSPPPRGAEQTACYRAGHRWAVQTQVAAVERARRLTTQLPPLTGVVGEGNAASLLATAGARAACIVLGMRTGNPASRGCDSTRKRCRALTTRPVVVVPETPRGSSHEKGPNCSTAGADVRRPLPLVGEGGVA
jgi:hypothetical protein